MKVIGGYGPCRFHPPTVVVVQAGSSVKTVWPITEAGEFCSRHEGALADDPNGRRCETCGHRFNEHAFNGGRCNHYDGCGVFIGIEVVKALTAQ